MNHKIERLERVAGTLEANASKREHETQWQRFNWIGIAVFWLFGAAFMLWAIMLRQQYRNAEEMALNAQELQSRSLSVFPFNTPKNADWAYGFMKAYMKENPAGWRAYQKAHPFPLEDK